MPDIIPEPALTFLRLGRILVYDEAASTVGPIRLLLPQQLSHELIHISSERSDLHSIDPYKFLDGAYQLEAVNLVAESDHYEPAGILAWIPKYDSFGSFDADHESLLLFLNATWDDIVSDPVKYLDAQWQDADVAQPIRAPWLDLGYSLADYDDVIEPYPQTCAVHGMKIITASTRSYPEHLAELRDPLRLRAIAEYLQGVHSKFPHSGVPITHVADLYCPVCFETEKAWLLRASMQQPQVVHPTEDGIVRCPHCRIAFSIDNPRALLHGFHRRCGTRLHISTERA